MFLPEVEGLKKQLLELGNEEFIKYWVGRYAKADAIIGSEESSNFIKQFMLKEYESSGKYD